MRKSSFFVLLVLVFLISSCGRYSGVSRDKSNQSQKTSQSEIELLQKSFYSLDGIWLNDAYIQNIQEKKYFLSLGILIYRISFTDYQDGFGWSMDFLTESKSDRFTGLRTTDEKDRYSLVSENGTESGVIVELADDQAVKIFYGDEIFTRIDLNEDDYINQATLKGLYMDEAGKLYDFGENCKASWPDRQFVYSFCDSMRSECNMITALNAKGSSSDEYYGFEYDKGSLYLYKMESQGSLFVRDPNPMATLKPCVINQEPLITDYDVGSIHFYESGMVDHGEDRVYKNRFPMSTTRCISWELGLYYEDSNVNRKFRVYQVFYREDGSIYGEGYDAENFDVEPNWTSSYPSWGFGNETPGTWPPGVYKVMVYINSELAAEDSFEIYDDSAEAESDLIQDQPVESPTETPSVEEGAGTEESPPMPPDEGNDQLTEPGAESPVI